MRQTGILATAMVGVFLCGALAACTVSDPRPMTETAATAVATAAAQTPRATTTPGASDVSAATRVRDAVASRADDTDITLEVGQIIEAPVPAPSHQLVPAPVPAQEAVAMPTHCIDEQLTLAYRARPQDSGAGSFMGDLVFTNISAADCSFDGWPGLIALSADGVRLGAPARASGGTSSLVVLTANGGVAVSELHGGQPGPYGCPATTSTMLRAYITSDGAGPGVAVVQSIPVCADGTSTLRIGPLGG
ncbi:DUF4232 domain-containing protein [Agromyces fucosus]|uniref:DUF4232 domain-containing protein n=1 Tax=Agromyces fucosus TaxID=41985 RepID=A0A4Q2JH27_9MICO|nr:DUF4232 domain-containing protein [Agromyces fucosus]RXZ47261.1 DUF4232 domain-containing protein [Agromyces fucosus]